VTTTSGVPGRSVAGTALVTFVPLHESWPQRSAEDARLAFPDDPGAKLDHVTPSVSSYVNCE
jgi:hypothetical protein